MYFLVNTYIYLGIKKSFYTLRYLYVSLAILEKKNTKPLHKKREFCAKGVCRAIRPYRYLTNYAAESDEISYMFFSRPFGFEVL